MSSPANIRIENRQAKNRRIWSSKKWKDAREKFLRVCPLCAWCGEPSELAHHPTDEYYGKDEYIDLHLSRCTALCKRCHFALHKGLILCPKCKENYCVPINGVCLDCDEERKAAKEKKEAETKALKRKIMDEQNALRRKIYKERKDGLH